MKTIEECLKILPEILYLTDKKYVDIIGKQYGLTVDDLENDWYYENAYIVITTNSARYIIKSNDYAHWDDLVVFLGDPTECCNKLVDWYKKYFK